MSAVAWDFIHATALFAFLSAKCCTFVLKSVVEIQHIIVTR
jgi:hypothetical protein